MFIVENGAFSEKSFSISKIVHSDAILKNLVCKTRCMGRKTDTHNFTSATVGHEIDEFAFLSG